MAGNLSPVTSGSAKSMPSSMPQAATEKANAKAKAKTMTSKAEEKTEDEEAHQAADAVNNMQELEDAVEEDIKAVLEEIAF